MTGKTKFLEAIDKSIQILQAAYNVSDIAVTEYDPGPLPNVNLMLRFALDKLRGIRHHRQELIDFYDDNLNLPPDRAFAVKLFIENQYHSQLSDVSTETEASIDPGYPEDWDEADLED